MAENRRKCLIMANLICRSRQRKRDNMLLKYGAKNFYSFKEGFEITLELGAKCPASISRGASVASTLCVKGANASGKTNALKVLNFLSLFCCHSFNRKPEEKLAIASFFNNSDPIDIFCHFEIDKIVYHYDVSLTEESVAFERLTRKSKRSSIIFERENDQVVNCIKELEQLKNVKMRANASIVSTANQYEVSSISPFYNFFSSITSNVAMYGKIDISKSYRSVTKYYKENPEIMSEAIELIKRVDLGVSGIDINKSTEEDGTEYYFPIFRHDVEEVERNWLTFHSESLGTQTLYKTLPYIISTLRSGGILVLDEFDTDYHPHILRLLISLFDNDESNPNHAQILFSTHNTEILEYMSKYRTVFVNKDLSESYAYRLDEIPGDIIRNDRPISPVYNSGKIGGVPRL